MKRSATKQDTFTRNTKRRKINRTCLTITADVIKHSIIPLGPLDWLSVSNEFHQAAMQHLLEDSRLLEKSTRVLCQAAETCNMELLNRLLQDERYIDGFSYAISSVYDIKERLILFVNHKCFSIEKDVFSALHSAVVNGWPDVVMQILNNSGQGPIWLYFPSSIGKRAPAETIRLIIHNPKIQFDMQKALGSAANNRNFEAVQAIVRDPRTDLKQAIVLLHHTSNGFKFLLDNSDILESSKLKKKLWSQVAKSNTIGLLEIALNCNTVDPSDDSNVALYEMCKHGSTEMIELLLHDERVMPTIRPSKRNPIVAAAKYQRKDIVDYLINHPKIDASWLNRALKFWAQKNNAYAVSFIVYTYGKYVTAKTKEKAMQSAIKRNHTKIMYFL